MRRLWLVIFMLALPILLLGMIVGTNLKNRPSEIAEALLRAYLAKTNKRIAQNQIRFVRSRQPNQFTKEMSLTTYSEGWYYQSDHTLNNFLQRSQSSFNATTSAPSESRRALIYPPVAAWCISFAPETDIAVVLAQHQDLYNAEWVVHEWSTESVQRTQLRTAIGCNDRSPGT